MTDASATTIRHDAKVLSLICTGHFASHFYVMVLPPLFPFLHDNLGISYTALGFMLSARYVATGLSQLPAGFLVDRYGAKMILIFGIAVMVAGYGMFAFATAYWALVLCVAISGIGDSVFHPADYSILNGSISPGRMGRAFSIHTFSGMAGWSVAPIILIFVADKWDWRAAVLVAVAIGFVIMLVLIAQWHVLEDDVAAAKKPKEALTTAPPASGAAPSGIRENLRMLTARPVLMLFLFFTMGSLANAGLNSFSVAALVTLGHSAGDSGIALTAYLATSAFAVLVGGVTADRIKRHDYFAAICLAVSALVAVVIAAVPLHYFAVVFMFTIAGFLHGVIRPARDMMVREVCPEGKTGKVFGFVFTGQNVGGAIAPIFYGFILDSVSPQWVFYLSALFLVICIATVI
ncbi:MAG: MFS transporter, partial [Alphaproteobacteria bacterium]